MRSGTEGRRDWELIIVTGIAVFAGICLTGIAAAISYSHMLDWARVNGEVGPRDWRAKLFPLSVDGSVVVSLAVIYADARAKRGRNWMAYIVGALGIAWSIGANVGHTWSDPAAKMLISAWPPIALAVCVELLLGLIKRVREQSEQTAVRKVEKVAPKVKAKITPIVDTPLPTKPESLPEIASITGDMRAAGWAPADYATAKDAMVGYLTKVNADISGAELDRIVGEHFTVSSGYGRRVVRDFKAQQAAMSESGN